MIGIIGKKLGMTQIFDEAGMQIPCTVVEATPNPVTKVVAAEKEGFAAVELGYGAQRTPARTRRGSGRPGAARTRRSSDTRRRPASRPPAVLRSFRLDDAPGKGAEIPTYNIGDVIKVDIFTVGEMVKVTGHDEGPRLPGRGEALGLRRRSQHARQHEAPQARLHRTRAPTRRA
jgi:large subunit ribosomal protein L3